MPITSWMGVLISLACISRVRRLANTSPVAAPAFSYARNTTVHKSATSRKPTAAPAELITGTDDKWCSTSVSKPASTVSVSSTVISVSGNGRSAKRRCFAKMACADSSHSMSHLPGTDTAAEEVLDSSASPAAAAAADALMNASLASSSRCFRRCSSMQSSTLSAWQMWHLVGSSPELSAAFRKASMVACSVVKSFV